MEITITLPESFVVQARGEELPVPIAGLSPEVIAQAVLHGIKQTVSDAASAAASGAYEIARKDDEPDWAKLSAAARKTWATSNGMRIAEYGAALMQKRVDALQSGEWTSRASAAPGMSRLDETIADLLATKMTFEKGTTKKDKLRAAFEAFEGLGAKVQAKVKAMAEARIEREKAEAALDIDLSGSD